MGTTGKSLLYGLVGDPVTHSLSPFIMNRAFEAMGLDAMYAAFGVRPERLAASIAGLASMGVAGLNVTFPYKEEVLYHVHAISSEAETINAINTIAFFDDEIHGFNTDAPGTATALETFSDATVEGARVFIYGAGAAARAAAYGLLERGAGHVTFAVRTLENGPMIAERFRYAFPEQEVQFVKLGAADDLSRRRDAFRSAAIVVNATPVGMAGRGAEELIEDGSWVRSEQTFFDFVYHPRRTAFLEAARRGGARTLGGIALLVAQAAESFRIWTDQGFDIKEMAEAVEEFSKADAPDGGRVN
jgi:shikimate dehydrogenase